MTSEYIEGRNGGYYVAGTRISLDSVVQSRQRPDAIREEYPLLTLPQIYGAIAFYLDHQAEIDVYLERGERGLEGNSVPMKQANPALRNELQRAPQSKSLVQFFRESPLVGIDLDFERDKDVGRGFDR